VVSGGYLIFMHYLEKIDSKFLNGFTSKPKIKIYILFGQLRVQPEGAVKTMSFV
jgi:hypothetical protein